MQNKKRFLLAAASIMATLACAQPPAPEVLESVNSLASSRVIDHLQPTPS